MPTVGMNVPVGDFLICCRAHAGDLHIEIEILARQRVVHVEVNIVVRYIIDACVHRVSRLIAQLGSRRRR